MKYLPNHKKIMIILTENCNLRCTYCYEQNKRGSSMNFEIAKKILDDAYSAFDGYENMIIELHGGEPFIKFSLIKEIDAYVMNRYSYIPVLFRAITNGTLVHGEVQDWLRERKNRYEIMLSLDGNETVHDMNRRTIDGNGSYKVIDLDFFLNTWKDCPISMTVTESTLPYLAENTIWLQQKGFVCYNAFQWATKWNVNVSVPILKRELDKLVAYYSDHAQARLCLLLNYRFMDFLKPIDSAYRYCVDIDDPEECYDAKGKYAPCHGFTEFTVGSAEIAAQFADKTIHDFVFEPENVCYNCKLVRLCRICFAANHMLTGNMQIQNEEICIFNRMCIMASIEILKNRMQKEASIDDNLLYTANQIIHYMHYRERFNKFDYKI